jgi:predicted nucleic acid-binding Zn ribbon protein
MSADSFRLRQHPEWVRGQASIEGDEIVLNEAVAERYLTDEYEHRQRLLMDLIALRDCEPQDVVIFVYRHGLLWHGPDHVVSGECREALTEWRVAVRHLWVTIGFYLTLNVAWEAGSAKPVRKYLQRLRDPDIDLFYARLPDNDRQVLEIASTLLAERITRGMEGCNWTFVAACSLRRESVQEGGPMDFLFGEDPSDLVAAAYAQLASLIANKVPLSECEGCGKTFIPKHGRKRYCTKRCSDRVRKARQRAKKG